MERFQDRNVLSNLLHESILQLCKVSVGLHSNITIDGIICIATHEDEKEIIVKIHEQIQRSTQPEPPKNILHTPKVPQTFCNEEQGFGQYPESGKTPAHIQSSRDYMVSAGDETDEIFSDMSAIKAILPLNRSEAMDVQQSNYSASMEAYVNLIDEDTLGEFMEKPTLCSESYVFVKPDPGTWNAASSCSVTTSTNCTVTSVLQTRPVAPQLHVVASHHRACDESSDDDLKIEKLKAGRTRKSKHCSSESANRTSPTDMINADYLPHVTADESYSELAVQQTIELDDDDTEITAASSKANNQRLDIKPIVVRKQTPTSLASPTTISLPPPSPQTTTIYTHTHIAPSAVQNIAPSEIVMDDVQAGPSQSVQSVATLPSPLRIQDTGMTVAQQLNLFRQQRLIQLDSSDTDTKQYQMNDVKLDELALTQSQPQKQYRCPTCGDSFAPFKKFSMHMFRQHSTFPCPVCEKLFTHRYTRNRHAVTQHADGKTFMCPFCNKKYVRADTLKLHIHKQHPDDASRVKITYGYPQGKQVYEPDSTATSTADSMDTSLVQQEQEVVYNRNLPCKFENVDSENSNPAQWAVQGADVISSQAQVVSQASSLLDSRGAQVQYLKLESMEGASTSHEDDINMHIFEHEDILDMIEISDDDSSGAATGRSNTNTPDTCNTT